MAHSTEQARYTKKYATVHGKRMGYVEEVALSVRYAIVLCYCHPSPSASHQSTVE